ncbi:SLC13 family permease [Candidatus Villigracilis affinis]|jgi:Na+/H+ antiporter NhaD/arsenite permease-like protein|uniref:SLC13 family permease n=1 Tax=Candidatus Villigracilis affinis TaxID=3140682 RepID=UPI002A19C94F|nr:anion permease [Anaerolineales bacterium]
MFFTLTIFILAYIAIASEKFPRHYVALLGAGLLIVFGILSPMEALSYINWETLGLLAGMFTLVSILQEAGFFTWLAMKSLKKVNYHPVALFVILIIFAAVMAMFMDSITVMLFLSALTLQLCRLLKLDPVPLVIAEVCAANTGGAATLVGDPPNVILGTTLGFNFADFITHTGPISAIAALLLLGMFYLTNRKSLMDAHDLLTDATITEIEALHNEPMHAHLTRVGLIGFLAAVILLVLHIPLSDLTGFHINAAMAALVPAGIALLVMKSVDRKKAVLKVDGESILFFAGLFVLIGGLEKIDIFKSMAQGLSEISTDNHSGLVMALHWIPGLASGIVDNVPLALAMSYVLKDLAAIPGMPALGLMVWSLALGVDIGGNLTPIGASANVVAYSFMERNHGSIGWKRWLVVAVPPTILAMLFASLSVMLKGHWGWY